MAQPQYTFDPVTQTYKLIDPMAPVAPVRGLGPLYNAGDGGADAVATPGAPNLGTLSPMATEIGVGLQNMGQFTATNPVAAAFSPVTSAVTTIAGNIGNSIMGTQVSPVANPTAPVETAIAPNPTVGLAAMNAQTAAQNQAQAQQAQVASTAEATASAVSGAADEASHSADGNNPGAPDSGSGGGGPDGGGGGTAGVGDESGHSADGNNSGGGGGGGDPDGNGTGEGGGWAKGGSVQRYGGGGVLANLFAQIKNQGLENPGGQYGMYSYDPATQTYTRNFAEGGLAAARKTENMGRGGDTMLVHMTPNEVRGLQAIAMAHGGSLTINPKTGLVEAGFLDSILPMVAGAALAATGVGAPMAALMVGGGMTLATGSLEKGLMAGLGAYGGAGLGAAFGAAGASATAPTVTGTMPGLAASGAPTAAQATQAAQAIVPEAVSATGAASTTIGGVPYYAIPTETGAVLAPQAAGGAAPMFDVAGSVGTGAPSLGQMGTGVSNVIQGTPGAREAFMTKVGGPMGLATKAAPIVASTMFSAEEPQEGGKKPQAYVRPYSYDMKPESEVNPDFAYRTGKPGESTAEQRYFTPTYKGMGVFKAGTEPGPSFYGTPTAEQYELYSKPKSDTQLGILGLANGGIANFDDQPGYDGMARGGLKDGAFIVSADVVSHLGNGSNDAGQKLLARGLGARPIKGKGDGMSDSIPTTIEGKQPARVADGEAYIPPEVVKKVGAKRLYAMMDKIRHARTGTKQQAPQVDPRKFIPA